MAQPDPRDARAFLHRPIARPPSFNEGDVTDKPYFLRRPPLSEAGQEEIVRLYRCGLASLRSVDRGVRRLVGELKRTAQLAHTVILFTSDQGLMAGQHRLPGGKDYPYEEAIRIPLAIRGPGIPHRARVRDLVANPDFVPTILDLAGIEHPDEGARPTDGRSLVPLLSGTSGWRERAVLIEGRFHTAPSRGGGFKAVSYDGVRSRRYLYVEWHLATAASHRAASHAALGAGRVVARELYDLAVDPYETQNRNADERYARARHRLSRIVDHLKDCGGSSCQVDRPIPPPSG